MANFWRFLWCMSFVKVSHDVWMNRWAEQRLWILFGTLSHYVVYKAELPNGLLTAHCVTEMITKTFWECYLKTFMSYCTSSYTCFIHFYSQSYISDFSMSVSPVLSDCNKWILYCIVLCFMYFAASFHASGGHCRDWARWSDAAKRLTGIRRCIYRTEQLGHSIIRHNDLSAGTDMEAN